MAVSDWVRNVAAVGGLAVGALGFSYGVGKDAGSSATAAGVMSRLGSVETKANAQDATIKDIRDEDKAFREEVKASVQKMASESEATRKAVEKMIRTGTMLAKGKAE